MLQSVPLLSESRCGKIKVRLRLEIRGEEPMSFVWEIQPDDTGTSCTHYRCRLIQEDRSSGELSPKGLFPKTAMIQQRTNMSPPKEVMKIHMSLPTVVSVLLVSSMPFFLKKDINKLSGSLHGQGPAHHLKALRQVTRRKSTWKRLIRVIYFESWCFSDSFSNKGTTIRLIHSVHLISSAVFQTFSKSISDGSPHASHGEETKAQSPTNNCVLLRWMAARRVSINEETKCS